jgi:hypothetical protein
MNTNLFLCDTETIRYISLNEELVLNGTAREKMITPLDLEHKTRNIKI